MGENKLYRTHLHLELRAYVPRVLIPPEVLHERPVDERRAPGQRARSHERRAGGEREELSVVPYKNSSPVS